LIECDTSKIPFLCALINHIKEHKLAALILGGRTHITETVDWDSPKGDLSCFVRMSQDHTCYNMSVICIEVRGIANVDKTADIHCPTSQDKLGVLLLQQTLMRYLKLQDGSPLCAKIHQQGLLGPVNMAISDTFMAEACFEMFNKQAAGYLYHVLLTFGESLTFIQDILRWSMDPANIMEAPLCPWDNENCILTTSQDKQIDGILSDVHSLPFFQDLLAVAYTSELSKSGREKDHTAPKMCFKLGSNCSLQTIHGANNRDYTKTTKPGAAPGVGIQAFAAAPATANQPVIELDNTDGSSSKEESDGEMMNPPWGHHPY
jgi:hypothetical protein